MPEILGHSGLDCKAIVAGDYGTSPADNPDMADRMSETEEKLAFIARVRAAREARFPKQKPMCTILGIEQSVYKHYEKRTALPIRYIPKFIAATGVSLEWLVTGEGQGPVVAEIPRSIPRRVAKRGNKAA